MINWLLAKDVKNDIGEGCFTSVLRIFLVGLFTCILLLTLFFQRGYSQTIRECVLTTAEGYVGVREATGKNDGPEIKKFLATCPLPEGYSYCGAYIGQVYIENCLPIPNSHCWSPAWNTPGTRVETPRPADVGTIYSYSKKRIVHVFLIREKIGKDVYTNEGNTNSGGSANGDGVYNRIRDNGQIYTYNDHIGNR